MEDYAAKSVTELRKIARTRGIRGVSALRKNDLVARLESEDRMAAQSSEPAMQTGGAAAEKAKSVPEKAVSPSSEGKTSAAEAPVPEMAVPDGRERNREGGAKRTENTTQEEKPQTDRAPEAQPEGNRGGNRRRRQQGESRRSEGRTGGRTAGDLHQSDGRRTRQSESSRRNARNGEERAESGRRGDRNGEERAESGRRGDARQNLRGAEQRQSDSRRGRRSEADSRREMNDRRGTRGRETDRRESDRADRRDMRDTDRRGYDWRNAEERRGMRGRDTERMDRREMRDMDRREMRDMDRREMRDMDRRDMEDTDRRDTDRMDRRDAERMDRRDYDGRDAEDRRGMRDRDMDRERFQGWNTGTRNDGSATEEELRSLDSGELANGILEVMPEGYGFIRSDNYLPGEDDIYVSPSQIRRFNMKTGDVITGSIRVKTGSEKFAALLYVSQINGDDPSVAEHRRNFEDLTPVFPHERIHLETPGGAKSARIVDLMSPIGKGQRGMIVSPPKAGKTTLLKEIAKAVQKNHPEMHIIILLIDERPEEVTDMKESIQGDNVEVIYSTFDEMPEHHKRVSEMVLGRAKRLVEHGRDVIILLDSITRLARAYNLTVAPSGRTLSGGLDPAALYMPKKFFGAARCMREGGSLTILATALIDTGSRMDDVVFEEFKGTGNMELVLDRKLSERRIFPAVDILKSGTRRDDLLLSQEEREAISVIRRAMSGMRTEDAVEEVLRLFDRTKNNSEFIQLAKKIRI